MELASDGLSAFGPLLREQVTARLRELLGLGPRAPLSWLARPDGEPTAAGPLEITLRLAQVGAVRFDLDAVRPDGAVWRRGQALQLGFRSLDNGASPMDGALGAVVARLGRAFQAREARLSEPLCQALEAARRFTDVEDRMFRQLTPGPGGMTATLRLGFGCNQDCTFCWQSRRWPEPPPEMFARWLEELSAAAAVRLSVTGGEPTLHRALPTLVARATELGLPVTLETNALRFRRPAFARALRDAGLRTLFVSLHSADAAVSDAMTRAPGTHTGTVAGIAGALDAGYQVILNCVVERINLSGLEAHARFVVESFLRDRDDTGGRVERVTYSHPCASYDLDAWAAAVAPLDEVGPHLSRAAALLAEAGVPVDVMGTCGFVPCVLHGAEHLIRGLGRDEVDEATREGRMFVAACDGCGARPHCLGLRREYVTNLGDRGVVPFASDPRPRHYRRPQPHGPLAEPDG